MTVVETVRNVIRKGAYDLGEGKLPYEEQAEAVVLALTGAGLLLTEQGQEDLRKLEELEVNGVDNWSGYDEIDWDYVETGVRSE